MIHNTFLVRTSTLEVLASTQYWPVEVSNESLEEFVTTRQDLKSGGDDYVELPLIIGDHKFHGLDWVGETILVFVTDKGEEEGAVFEKMEAAGAALRRVLAKSGLETVVSSYASIIEPSITTRLKIALVGEGGVGKTTTLHLLLGDTPPLQYVPTIALNLETVENIRFGNYSLVLWDFAGQERFRTLWRFYFHGADVIFLVCDSTLRNVIISKDILKLIRRDAPKVPVFAMANKQDKPNAMKPEVVQKILGIPTYPMVAIDKARRDEMLRILMTAAAQYVGVALPDLPAAELLKFTDTATEEAIAEVEASHLAEAEDEEEEYEFVEIVEEVYVDEEGHVIEDTEDYEIVEEVVEEIGEEAPLASVAEITEDAVASEEAIEEEPPIAAQEASQEILGDELPIEDVLTQMIDEALGTKEQDEEVSAPEAAVATQTPEDAVTIDTPLEPLEFDIPTVGSPSSEQEMSVEVSVEPEQEAEVAATPLSESLSETGVGSVSEANGTEMAREIISEALDADELIAAEIEKVSKEEIDVALSAFACDEVIPRADESDACDEIDEESLMELEAILGPLDKSVGGMGESTEEKDYLPIDNDTLSELSRLLDLQEDEEED
ncbi:GTP-binding protein [Candidatus Thorarchaeota archaeon]|nr:MAG: GTP-binding protein [Candidatus Thorarchaeota archaeon]